MERKQIASSNIKSVGYEPSTATLEVEFSNGVIYQYNEVPLDVADGFIDEPIDGSHGKHLAAKIKGKYQSVKIS